MRLRDHLTGVPTELAEALDSTVGDALEHFLRREWDDAQVDAGRFCEAALRYLQWKMKGSYTPIDGKSKPNRKQVVVAAQQDSALPPTLRAQVPQCIELVMDFRNNRNTAHLGNLKASHADAAFVIQAVTWVIAEMARLQSQAPVDEIQMLVDRLAERQVPVIQRIDGVPVVLDTKLSAADKALVLLYENGGPVAMQTLREWAEYSHSTKWRDNIIGGLRKAKLVHLDKAGAVHLLRPGEARAQQLLVTAAATG